MINIHTLKTLNHAEQITITEHARIRLIERRIVLDDVINCINSGKITKQYEDDKPFPSCLILGISTHNTPIHIVVSTDNEYIHLITAYYPDQNKWESDFILTSDMICPSTKLYSPRHSCVLAKFNAREYKTRKER